MNTTTQLEQTMVEGFIASGERLYQKQRERMQVEQAAFLEERFRLLQEFELKAAKLANEREDALRDLERRYAKTLADGERMLSALQSIREG